MRTAIRLTQYALRSRQALARKRAAAWWSREYVHCSDPAWRAKGVAGLRSTRFD